MAADVALAPAASTPLAEPKTVAIFDLDGTLTARDTLLPFLRFTVGPARFYTRLPIALLVVAAMALGLVSRRRAKEWVLSLYLRGWHRLDLASRAEAFAREKLPSLVRPQAGARLAWHRARGHECVVASASLALYIQPWAAGVGIARVVATELKWDAHGYATGRIAGENCRGAEKLRRLEEELGELAALNVHGYGDSRADRAFLDKCSQPHYRSFSGEGDASRPQRINSPGELLKLLRPHQWLKNAFVFVGVVFGHAWFQVDLLLAAALAAGAFSLAASAIYVVNDYADRERDRLHPKKRHRPLAAGSVTPNAAFVLAGALALAAAGLAAAAGKVVIGIVAAYAVMNLAYSFSLKGIVILDVFIIAAGFILRILAGTLAIGIYPSQWLIVCSLFLTLFLGFTKRRAELLSAGSDFLIHRKVLLSYNASLLDKMISVCACAALMCYALYTTSPVTQEIHHTDKLVYTLPFVVYGFFRYLFLLHARQAGTDTSVDLARDKHLIATVLAWSLVTAWLIA